MTSIESAKRAIVATVVAALVLAAGVTVGAVALTSEDGLPRGVAFQVAGHYMTQAQLDVHLKGSPGPKRVHRAPIVFQHASQLERRHG